MPFGLLRSEMATTPKITGGVATSAAKLTSRIPLIVAELDEKTLEGVVEIAERIVEGARERVPDAPPLSEGLIEAIHVETGTDLVKSTEAGFSHSALSVTAEELSAGAVAVVAGDHDHFYGHIIENGGVHTPPRPFLVPAFEAERSNLEKVVGKHVKELE